MAHPREPADWNWGFSGGVSELSAGRLEHTEKWNGSEGKFAEFSTRSSDPLFFSCKSPCSRNPESRGFLSKTLRKVSSKERVKRLRWQLRRNQIDRSCVVAGVKIEDFRRSDEDH
jgi:hypothetical protein